MCISTHALLNFDLDYSLELRTSPLKDLTHNCSLPAGPKQFKADFMRFDSRRQMKVYGKFAFDEDNKMIAEIEDETFAGANR